MKEIKALMPLIFLLSFCSIVYELLLAQGLSAFLENTVLRYSVTIGFYMCSMGFGAMMTEGALIKKAAQSLVLVEMCLVVIGGFSLVWMHLLNLLPLPRLIFSLAVHLLIIAIGFLSGMELPLLIELAGRQGLKKEDAVLSVNYMGAFTGTIAFAFIFYARFGLLPTAFFTGFLNACAAAVLLFDKGFLAEARDRERTLIFTVGAVIFLLISVCCLSSAKLDSFFINQYLG